MKKYLNKVKELDIEIKDKLDRLQYIKDKLTDISVKYKPDSVSSSSRNTKGSETLIIEKIMLEEEILKDINRRHKLIQEVSDVIDTLEDEKLREIMVLRYLRNFKWEVIATEVKLCKRQCYRLHKTALEKLEKNTKNHLKSLANAL